MISLVILPSAPSQKNSRQGKREFFVRSFRCVQCDERLRFDTVDGVTYEHCTCHGWVVQQPAMRMPTLLVAASQTRHSKRGARTGKYEHNNE